MDAFVVYPDCLFGMLNCSLPRCLADLEQPLPDKRRVLSASLTCRLLSKVKYTTFGISTSLNCAQNLVVLSGNLFVLDLIVCGDCWFVTF